MVRIVDGRRVSVCRSSLVELFGLITCGVRGIGEVDKLPAARAEVRWTRVFGSGTLRQGRCRHPGREGCLEVTVREQQGRRKKLEKGEGEIERYDMRTANTLSHACTRSLYATQGKCVRKMCVRHGVCVQNPSSKTQNTNNRRNNDPRTNDTRDSRFGLPDVLDQKPGWCRRRPNGQSTPPTRKRRGRAAPPIRREEKATPPKTAPHQRRMECNTAQSRSAKEERGESSTTGLWALELSLSLTCAMVTLFLGNVAFSLGSFVTCCVSPPLPLGGAAFLLHPFGTMLLSRSLFWVVVLLSLHPEITQVGLMSYGACHTFPLAVFLVFLAPLAPFVLLL